MFSDRLELGVGSATNGSSSVADLQIAEEWIVPPFDQVVNVEIDIHSV